VSNPTPFQIPIVDLHAQYRKIRKQAHRAIDEVNESQQFILGPAVSQFEAQMASYLGCARAVGVASGSDALLLALIALDIGPGDAVITTPFTFFSTVSSITRLGARPLFVDIDPDTYLISARSIDKLLKQRGEIDGHSGTRDGKSHVFNNYVIGAERRNELKQFLARRGIPTEIYYPLRLHLQTCFAELGYKKGDFPHAELATSHVLALPLYPELTLVQQKTVVGAIRNFYRA
jgi:dTDP-4-amino-4,6-dideoxygalactose transaminase